MKLFGELEEGLESFAELSTEIEKMNNLLRGVLDNLRDIREANERLLTGLEQERQRLLDEHDCKGEDCIVCSILRKEN